MAQDFTVDRNSSKWVLGADGYLKEYTTDQPAIEFNADGSYKGVLVEPESVNEARQSEDLDNATYWDDSFDVSIAANSETDPKGGTNSFLLAETTGSSQHLLINESAYRPTITSGETWTQSVYLKKGTGANAPNIVQLTFSSVTHGAGQYANFNISTGTVLTTSGGTAAIQDAGNGWYRCSWTATAISTASNGCVIVVFTNNDDSLGRQPSYAGQTDANVFIWGAQLEESPIATSYIPTTTGAVTRNKDDIYLTSASSLIGQTEGTLFVEVDYRDAGQNQFLLSLSDGTYDNRVHFYVGGSSNLVNIIEVNNASPVVSTGATTITQGINKFALCYANNDAKSFLNGAEEASSSPDLSYWSTNPSLTLINFGDRQQSAFLPANMWIRAVALYITRLTDTQCEELTTI